MENVTNGVLKNALNALDKELKKEPLSSERVLALSEAIKVLGAINPLARL